MPGLKIWRYEHLAADLLDRAAVERVGAHPGAEHGLAVLRHHAGFDDVERCDDLRVRVGVDLVPAGGAREAQGGRHREAEAPCGSS